MGKLLTVSSVLQCPHGGQVQIVSTNTKAKVGDFLVRSSDTFLIVGCPFTIGIVYHPCVRVQWVSPAVQVKAQSDTALTDESIGMCLAADNAPQGTVLIQMTQIHAKGH